MKLRISPVTEHQPLATATLATEWSKKMKQSKTQANEVRVKPSSDVGIRMSLRAIAVKAIHSGFASTLPFS
jgi:hypothetical protein